MKIWKTKTGERIEFKEFINRFKSGIQSITPLQKLQNEQRATFIMLIGYLVGLVSLFVYRESFVVAWFTYALMIIFLGATYGQVIKLFALMTQLKMFKNIEESIDLDNVLNGLEETPEEIIEKDKEIDDAEKRFRKQIDERRLKEDGNNNI